MLLKHSLLCTMALALTMPLAWAQKKYDPGASDTEIKIGQTSCPTAAPHPPTA